MSYTTKERKDILFLQKRTQTSAHDFMIVG